MTIQQAIVIAAMWVVCGAMWNSKSVAGWPCIAFTFFLIPVTLYFL